MSADTPAILAYLAAVRERAEADWLSVPPQLRYVQGPTLGVTVPARRFRYHADLPALLAVAEAAARLTAEMDTGDDLPWWCRYAEDGIGFLCLGCYTSREDTTPTEHDPKCPALALDAALTALVREGGGAP